MKTAILTSSEAKKEFFLEQRPDALVFHHRSDFIDEILDQISDCEILSTSVYTTIDAGILAKLPKLQYIITQSTGFDHIDIATCTERGITVCNIPSYGERSIAEYTIGLIFTLARNIHIANERAKDLNFCSYDLKGFDLQNKTLGIIGTGAIGKEVVKLAKAVGMRIIASDTFPNESFAQEHGFSYVPLRKLLAQSDMVSLHVPYTPETHHMIDSKALSGMKNGAYLINTARGAVVDQDALIEALEAQKIAGAALDVLENEKILFSQGEGYVQVSKEFKKLKEYNVIYTPHMAAYSQEAQVIALKTVVKNIQSCAADTPINIVRI